MEVTYFTLFTTFLLKSSYRIHFWLTHWGKIHSLEVPGWEEGYQIVIHQFTSDLLFHSIFFFFFLRME